jgi:hypothetical protein
MEQEQRDLFLQKSPTAVKPGVQELFDSNPELANQVYESLGFKQNNNSSIKIASTIYELIPNITEDKIDEIYNNYVSLINKTRKDKEISKERFKSLLKSYQVFNYKDTYIFGNYDNESGVFITRVNSSPSSRELLAEALPILVKQGIDFASFVPEDVADKYRRSGYSVSTQGFDYNFKGEDMVKYLAVSNPNVSLKIFNKSLNELSNTDIENYNNSIELKYNPVEIKGDLIEKAGKDASKVFETYLTQFGIKVKDINEIKDRLGIDELGFADILSKIAYVKDRKDLPPVAGEFIAYMMQYNPLVSDIIKELSQTSSYKNLNKSEYFKVIGGLIAQDLQNKLEGKYSKSLLEKLKQLIKEFFSTLNNTPVNLINKNIGTISNNILQQNRKLITASLYKPGAFGKATKQVSLQEAMESDKFGASIIENLSKKGFILTGSTSLGEQGTIQRPDENLLHDIDWVSPFNRTLTEELFKEVYPEAIKIRDIYGEGYVTDTWIISPKGYKIVNLERKSDYNIITSYDIVDKNNKIVGTYRLQKQKDNNQNEEIVIGIEAKVIDFFSYEEYNQIAPFEKNGIKLANWKEIFNAKLQFARYKDIWDYNRFIPNENVQQITPQQKEQALQLYSQYLNSIFPDSQVKDIVYHGTDKEFDKFKKPSDVNSKNRMIAFADDIEYAKIAGGRRTSLKKVITAIVNINKLYPVDKLEAMELDSGYRDEVLNELKKEDVDGFAFESDDDLATKNFNEVLVFEPEQIHILGNENDVQGFRQFISEQGTSLQKSSTETLPSNASPKTLKLIKDFLKQVGVDINVVKDIIVNGVKQDADGAAQLMQKIASVVEGKEAQALPEEAMHFAVAIIKQTNPKLYQKLLKEINNYDMLTKVFKEYGSDPLYQKDGKPDVIKLKEEAIAKVLVEKIIQKTEGVTEKPQNLATAQSWWKSILDWFKELLYIKSGLDQVTIDIISGKEIGTADDIRERNDSLFFQKTKQDSIYDTLKDISNRIKPQLNAQGIERYFIDGVEIPNRVSDIAGAFYKSQTDISKDEYDEAFDELRSENGTKGHLDFQHAFTLFVNSDGTLKEKDQRELAKANDNHVSDIGNQDFYNIIRDNLEARLVAIDQKNGGGTKFLSEIVIYDGKKTGGTLDLLAISKTGRLNIFDWKFMNLNLEKYSDVPWYKIKAWNVQLDGYKEILIANYGVQLKDFDQTRMIPIIADYSKGKKDKDGKVINLPRLIGVKIGDVDVKNIDSDEDYLLPVPTVDESTGNFEIDQLIKKLNAAYERFSKEKVKEENKSAKKEQLEALFKAIRRLQVKRDVGPLIEQAKLLLLKVDSFYDEYNKNYKLSKTGEEFTKEELENFTEEELNKFSNSSESLLNALNTYKEIHILLREIADDQTKNELRDISDSAVINIAEISKINESFVNDIIAKREAVDNLLSPEKIIRGLTKLFSSTSTLQVASIQLLFKKVSKALGRASFATQDESLKLISLRDKYLEWAKSKGYTQKNMFSILKKKDKNQLIDQYKKEFYKELNKAIKDGDVNWIKNNVDESLLNDALEKELEKEIQRIQNKGRLGDGTNILRLEIEKAKAKYSIATNTSKGWFLKNIVKNFPLQKWETEDWKNLNSAENAPAKDFYNYIIEKNNEYSSLGYISKSKSRIFLPFVEGSILEAAIKGDKLTLGERFWRSISIDAGDVGYGQIDPESGQIINSIPKYFTTPFEGQLSEDLFKTMMVYNESAQRFKYLTEIEDQVRSIARIERNKKSILTSNLGNVQRDEYGNIQYEPEGGVGNYELLDSMVKSIVYGQRYVDNQNLDAALGKLGTWGKTLNEKIGFDLFPENLDGRVMTISKIVDNLNTSFSLATLGFNAGSSISNLFGGHMQSIINSGKYFTKTDFYSSELQVFANKFNGEDKDFYIKSIEYFLPFTDNYNREVMKGLSVNPVTGEQVQDFIMIAMRSADRAVQTANFYAFLKNSVVIDGKVLNAREYLRTLPEYKNKYDGSSEDRKAFNEKFDEEVKKLIEEKGVQKLAKIVDGKFTIPGVDRMSNSVLDLRRKVQQLSKDAMGNLSDDDVRLINMTILGKSFMVFKNWIPRLVDVRFGGLKYNSASDAYEWGRMRTVMSLIQTRMWGSFKSLRDVYTGNDAGIKLIREAYEKKAEQYKLETGKTLEMDETLFIDLYTSNIKGFATDLMFLLGLFSLVTSQMLDAPDDDEDPMIINQHKFISKIADKLLDELMYFYNPTSILNLVGSGPFPAMSLVNNGFKSIWNFFREMYGLTTGNDELVEDIKVIKYVMRTFPVANQMVGYLPLVYPDIAKDLGIRITTNYGIR